MTLGNLIDLIREVEGIERDLEAAQRSVRHGGSEHTMDCKREEVAYLTGQLAGLRIEEITKD